MFALALGFALLQITALFSHQSIGVGQGRARQCQEWQGRAGEDRRGRHDCWLENATPIRQAFQPDLASPPLSNPDKAVRLASLTYASLPNGKDLRNATSCPVITEVSVVPFR